MNKSISFIEALQDFSRPAHERKILMSKYEINISTDRHKEKYIIENNDHHHSTVNAAIEALQTFSRHNHSRFPYNRQDIDLKVKCIDE